MLMLAINRPQRLTLHSLQQLPEPPSAPESRYYPVGLVAVAGVGAGLDAAAAAAAVEDVVEVVGGGAVATPSQETR